jgi:hypothetical protein
MLPAAQGIKPSPHIMVPLVGFEEELSHQVGAYSFEHTCLCGGWLCHWLVVLWFAGALQVPRCEQAQ